MSGLQTATNSCDCADESRCTNLCIIIVAPMQNETVFHTPHKCFVTLKWPFLPRFRHFSFAIPFCRVQLNGSDGPNANQLQAGDDDDDGGGDSEIAS